MPVSVDRICPDCGHPRERHRRNPYGMGCVVETDECRAINESPRLRRLRIRWMTALALSWLSLFAGWFHHFARGKSFEFWCALNAFTSGAVVAVTLCIIDRWRHRNDP